MSQFDRTGPKEVNNLIIENAEFEDVSIGCVDCDQEFIWSVGEQEFFRDKGLKNPPKRCKSCKKAKNSRIDSIQNSRSGGSGQKIEVLVDCAECDEATTVPFYPSQGRPVYCRSCFLAMNPQLVGKKDKP